MSFSMKGGWHPKGKDGGKESWRGDFKGINQVAGWVGKGKKSDTEQASEHVSRPLATLKDPSAFGPPPKNVNYHGGAALPNEITPHRSGWGAPMTQEQIESANRTTAQEAQAEEPPKPAAPPLPYRADRTGLNTSHLPPPPVHRDLQRSPVQPVAAGPSPQPRLPPRLPSRQNSSNDAAAAAESPPAYDAANSKPAQSGYLSQSAMNRLGNAGVSVPAFGIGRSSSSDTTPTNTNHMSELSSRFSRMNSSNSQNQTITTPQPAEQAAPPSWQQSQHAFQTASNLRSNPNNVTLADAHSAAQTAGQAQRSASAFREKHADSISNAQAKAKAWDQKYKVTSKINKFLDEHSDETHQQQQQQPPSVSTQGYAQETQHNAYAQPSPVVSNPSASDPPTVSRPNVTGSLARKPPPPPPPKKPATLQAPPPVPVGTKPSFG